MRKIIIVGSLLLTGCVSSDWTDFKNTEAAWQLAHLIDVGQTAAIARNPECYYETSAETRNLIGEHPQARDVYFWGLSVAIIHYVSRKWIADNFDEKISVAVRFYDLGYKLKTIQNNHTIGLRPDGSSKLRPIFDEHTGASIPSTDRRQKQACTRERLTPSVKYTWRF